MDDYAPIYHGIRETMRSSLLLCPVSFTILRLRDLVAQTVAQEYRASPARDAAARHQILSAIVLITATEGVQTVEDDPTLNSDILLKGDT